MPARDGLRQPRKPSLALLVVPDKARVRQRFYKTSIASIDLQSGRKATTDRADRNEVRVHGICSQSQLNKLSCHSLYRLCVFISVAIEAPHPPKEQASSGIYDHSLPSANLSLSLRTGVGEVNGADGPG